LVFENLRRISMRKKIANLDKKSNEPKWNLYFTLVIPSPDDSTAAIRVINFSANSPEKALRKALKILQASARRITKTEFGIVSLTSGKFHPFAPVDTKNLFRLKFKCANKRTILKIKEENLREYFVRGYGPKALKQLEEGL
jgi:hypothetical protein